MAGGAVVQKPGRGRRTFWTLRRAGRAAAASPQHGWPVCGKTCGKTSGRSVLTVSMPLVLAFSWPPTRIVGLIGLALSLWRTLQFREPEKKLSSPSGVAYVAAAAITVFLAAAPSIVASPWLHWPLAALLAICLILAFKLPSRWPSRALERAPPPKIEPEDVPPAS